MIQDDRNNRPLTDKERAHIDLIEKQPGYAEWLKNKEKEINKRFGVKSRQD
jgi:hypothetical protein